MSTDTMRMYPQMFVSYIFGDAFVFIPLLLRMLAQVTRKKNLDATKHVLSFI
jgi:hypothetical protein